MVRKNNCIKTILIAVGMSLSILVLCLSCSPDQPRVGWDAGIFGVTKYRDVELGMDISELKQRFSHFKKQPFTAAYPDIYHYKAKSANNDEGIENWNFGFIRVSDNSLRLKAFVMTYDNPKTLKDWKQLVEVYTKKYGKPDIRRRHKAIWSKPLRQPQGTSSDFEIWFRPKDGTLKVSLEFWVD